MALHIEGKLSQLIITSLIIGTAGLILGGCDDTSEEDARDCRNDGVGCTEGFTCVSNASSTYECLPTQMSGGTPAGGIEGGTEGGRATPNPIGGASIAGDEAGGREPLGGSVRPDDYIPPPRDESLDAESAQLIIPFDDPTDPRTISAVLGIREVRSTDDQTIIIEIGPSFNVPEAESLEAYNIYSPDDDQYAYEAFVEPTSVSIVSRPAAVSALPDNRGRPFETHEVTLSTPSPLIEGRSYFVRAIGGHSAEPDPTVHHRDKWEGYSLTGGRNAGHFIHGQASATEVNLERINPVMGIRRVTIASPHHLRLEIGAGGVPDLLDDINHFTIGSLDDDAYGAGLNPVAVGRRTYPEVFAPGYGYPFPRKLNRSEVYLELPIPLTEASTYTISVTDGATSGRDTLNTFYSDDSTHNHHLKVNQVGYRPDAPVKIALLGAWMGTLGTLQYSEMSDRACLVVDADTGAEVFESTLTLTHGAEDEDEGAYRMNFTKEDIYQCDFTALSDPGEYYIKIPEMGRSYQFTISDQVYLKPFQAVMRGIFYQRAGQAIDESNSAYRRVAGHTEPISIPYMEDRPIIGGHYDAGDFNPRIHYDVVHILLLTYEMFPQKFSDGQLDIPERGNGIPDILDEAMWGIYPLLELQDEDGGIGFDEEIQDFIESENDPNHVETVERDPWRQKTYDKHPQGALITAAITATASRIWASLGEEATAGLLIEAARRSYDWAQQNGAQAHINEYAWAAAELARTTREQRFLDDFRASGYVIEGTFDDGNMVRLRAAFSLALDLADDADAELSNLMYSHIRTLGDLLKSKSQYGYPHFQHPYSPVSWGTAAYPHTIETMIGMWRMAQDESALKFMTHSADFSLGLNALNQSWTTGIGDRPVYGPTHLFAWNTYLGIIPPGLQVEGPYKDPDYIKRFMNENTPPPEETPQYYNYYDVRYSIALNEGVVGNQAWTAFLYGALLPDLP